MVTGRHVGVHLVVIEDRGEDSELTSYFLDLSVNCAQEESNPKSSPFGRIKEID